MNYHYNYKFHFNFQNLLKIITFIVTFRPATQLWIAMKLLQNMKKWKVCRVCLAHFTEHLFCFSYFTSFRSRWWFFDESSTVPYRVLCKSALIHNLESKFHENGKKCVKECFRFHLLFCETPWNCVWNVKYDKCVAGIRVLRIFSKLF